MCICLRHGYRVSCGENADCGDCVRVMRVAWRPGARAIPCVLDTSHADLEEKAKTSL